MRLDVRPAVKQDIVDYYGANIHDVSMMAYVWEYAGNIVLIGGVALGKMPLAFMDYRGEVTSIPGWKKAMIKGSLLMMDYIVKNHEFVFAVSREDEIAPGFLNHFGFHLTGNYNGFNIFRWSKY